MSQYDAIIVGAGIHGVLLALSAVDRGRSVLLIDKGKAGRATTDNSFGLVHGGLRYLQKLDFERWRRSRVEQAWYMRKFPDLAVPLACVMPLYRGAFRSPATFSLAFAMERSLVKSVRDQTRLPAGRILSAKETQALFPQIVKRGLIGAAEWHDVSLLDPAAVMARLVGEFLLKGGELREDCEVNDLIVRQGAVSGVVARRSPHRKFFRGHKRQDLSERRALVGALESSFGPSHHRACLRGHGDERAF